MRKGKNILGLQVTSQADGAELGTVKDLIFDHNTDEVIGLLISDKELFGLIDAQVVPWSKVRAIGSKAVMVDNADAKIKAGDDTRINAILDRNTALSGTKIRTTEGEDLGSFADLYLDENTGRVVGYEVSSGFFSDTMSGKHYMPADSNILMGQDVALVSPQVAAELEAKKEADPGGLKGAVNTAKDKVSDTYSNIADASVEKQKEFIVGKVASRDVFLPITAAPIASAESGLPAPEHMNALPETVTEGLGLSELGAASSDVTLNRTNVDSQSIVTTPPVGDTALESNTRYAETPLTTLTTASGDVEKGAVLVRQGETITRDHADRAENAGILHQLLLAAGGTVAGGVLDSGKEKWGDALNSGKEQLAGLQGNAEESAIGKTAGTEVTADDGSTIVAPGMIITNEIMGHARTVGKEKAVIAAAGIGAASQGAETVKEHAASLWDTIKEKAADLTGAAQGKKEEYDAQAEQKRINDALGRPTTRVILDPSDTVILNTGDLITHAAIDRAREAGALDVLLDSVYTADPEITPEMLRAREPGEAALPTQAIPSGGPITATVAPNASQPSQDAPAQGQTS